MIPSKKSAIHQWLPGFSSGDAISNSALVLRDIIREWGVDSEIFCPMRHVSPKMRAFCKDYETYSDYSRAENTVIYHFSIGSPMSEMFKSVPDRKVLIYHNITPDKYFKSINAEKALVLFNGREELKTLRAVPSLAIADSEYNRMELQEWGYSNTRVVPPLLDFEGLSARFDKKTVNRYKDSWDNILFVGRVTPNKKIEDVIKVFYYYKNCVNKESRLFIVGSFVGMEKYYSYLRAMVLELGLRDVVFTGHVTTPELAAYYKVSDLFLCMSEHEGFCVPLVESMYFGIPIVAYNSSAIPYTLAGSGVLVDQKDYQKIAELVGVILSDNEIKKKIVDRQKIRFRHFTREKIAEEFRSILHSFNPQGRE